jgi:hypothetical protein
VVDDLAEVVVEVPDEDELRRRLARYLS